MIIMARNLKINAGMRPAVYRDAGAASAYVAMNIVDEQGNDIGVTMRSPSDMREIAAQLNKLADELEQVRSQKGVEA